MSKSKRFGRKFQRYFVGAVKILKESRKIDFDLMFAGKLDVNELKQVKLFAKPPMILPKFYKNKKNYRESVLSLRRINEIT